MYVVGIFLVPLMIYGTYGTHKRYQAGKGQPDRWEVYRAQEEKMLKDVLSKHNSDNIPNIIKKLPDQSSPRKFEISDEFNIPLNKLLEGNHGRYL